MNERSRDDAETHDRAPLGESMSEILLRAIKKWEDQGRESREGI